MAVLFGCSPSLPAPALLISKALDEAIMLQVYLLLYQIRIFSES